MTDHFTLDEELRRVLVAAQQPIPALELQQFTLTQSSIWPWQVPQTPAYTSDHTPTPTPR